LPDQLVSGGSCPAGHEVNGERNGAAIAVALSWIKVFRFIWLDWLLQDRAKKVTRQNGVISYLPFGMLFIKI
jgi:hypothetical protein